MLRIKFIFVLNIPTTSNMIYYATNSSSERKFTEFRTSRILWPRQDLRNHLILLKVKLLYMPYLVLFSNELHPPLNKALPQTLCHLRPGLNHSLRSSCHIIIKRSASTSTSYREQLRDDPISDCTILTCQVLAIWCILHTEDC